MSTKPKKKRTRTNNNGLVQWVNPNQFSKKVGKSPSAIVNAIKNEIATGKPTYFEWKINPKNKKRFLCRLVGDGKEQTVVNPKGNSVFEYLASNIDRDDILKKMQDAADTDQRIKEEKLKKLEIDNKKESDKYIDKKKFNRDFFTFLRDHRDKLLALSRAFRIKKSKLDDHEFELFITEKFEHLLNELAEFKYYDSDNNTNSRKGINS